MAMTEESKQATIVAKGDIVASNAEAIRSELLDLIHSGMTTLVFDTARVSLIDSTGLGVLIAAHNQLKSSKGHLRLVNVGSEVMRMLHLMNLHRDFDMVAAQ